MLVPNTGRLLAKGLATILGGLCCDCSAGVADIHARALASCGMQVSCAHSTPVAWRRAECQRHCCLPAVLAAVAAPSWSPSNQHCPRKSLASTLITASFQGKNKPIKQQPSSSCSTPVATRMHQGAAGMAVARCPALHQCSSIPACWKPERTRPGTTSERQVKPVKHICSSLVRDMPCVQQLHSVVPIFQRIMHLSTCDPRCCSRNAGLVDFSKVCITRVCSCA